MTYQNPAALGTQLQIIGTQRFYQVPKIRKPHHTERIIALTEMYPKSLADDK